VLDHITIRATDRAASELFYDTVLRTIGVERSSRDTEYTVWKGQFSLANADGDHPATRRLHIGFAAPSRDAVDEFWRAGTAAGYQDDGEPGLRPQYSEDYYGAFLLDPDGNSVEAVHDDSPDAVPVGAVDHLWIRVRDVEASRRFYAEIAPHAGLRLTHDGPDRVQLSGPDYSVSLVRDERPLTEPVHLAFPAREDAAVRAFHAAALAAGGKDNGGPGERPAYRPGYYAAFVLDPDGHNVEVVNRNPG
jgi:catechol 2,3-dioxygenase-like lactoylglutathione lyase family enzyme